MLIRQIDTEGPLQILRTIAAPIQDWCMRIRAVQPSAIVTLARKGTRLVEVISEFLFPEPLPRDRIISDLALAYVPVSQWRGEKVAILDDIVIWGTAMRSQEENLRKNGLVPLLYSVAVSRGDAGWVKPDKVVSLKGTEVSGFCNSVVRSIGLLNKPYDVEHPILYFGADLIGRRFGFNGFSLAATTHHLTVPSQEEHMLLRETIGEVPLPVPLDAVFQTETGITPVGLQKIRFYGSIPTKQIAAVPMFIFQWPSNILEACNRGKVFNRQLGFLNNLVADVAGLIAANDGFATSQKSIAATRLCAYITSYLLGAKMSKDLLGRAQFARLHDGSTGKLSSWDLQIIFGPYVAQRILRILEDNSETIADFAASSSKNVTLKNSQLSLFEMSGPDVKGFDTKDVLQIGMEAFWSSFERQALETLSRTTDSEESLLAIFKAMRVVYDIGTRDRSRYNPDRLRLGLTLDGIRQLLRLANKEIPAAHMSTAIDFLVDVGAIVPFYLQDNLRAVHRVFRFGEDLFGLDKAPYTLREVLTYTLNTFDQQDISYIRFDKLVAFVVAALEPKWRQNDTFVGLYWDRFGGRTQFKTPWQDLTLIEYCKKQLVADFVIKRIEGKRPIRRVALHPGFESLHSTEDCVLNEATELSPLRIHLELFWELTKGERDYRHTLALTSCFSSYATIQALVAEIGQWVQDEKLGIPQVVWRLAKASASEESDLADIAWRIPVIPTQMWLKHSTFKNLDGVLQEFDDKLNHITPHGRLLANLWNQTKGYIRPETTKLDETKLEALAGIADLMAWLCSGVQQFLRENKISNRPLSLEKHGFHAQTWQECFEIYDNKLSALSEKFPDVLPQPHFVYTHVNKLNQGHDHRGAIVGALRDSHNDFSRWATVLSSLMPPMHVGVGLTYIVAYDGEDSCGVPFWKRPNYYENINCSINQYIELNMKEHVRECPCRPDDGQHIILSQLRASWEISNHLHRLQYTLQVRLRIAMFDAIGVDELFIDVHSGHFNGDAHALIARELPFSDEIDGSGIVVTSAIAKELSRAHLLGPSAKLEVIGRKAVKGKRLHDLDLVFVRLI